MQIQSHQCIKSPQDWNCFIVQYVFLFMEQFIFSNFSRRKLQIFLACGGALVTKIFGLSFWVFILSGNCRVPSSVVPEDLFSGIQPWRSQQRWCFAHSNEIHIPPSCRRLCLLHNTFNPVGTVVAYHSLRVFRLCPTLVIMKSLWYLMRMPSDGCCCC